MALVELLDYIFFSLRTTGALLVADGASRGILTGAIAAATANLEIVARREPPRRPFAYLGTII